MEAVTLRIGLGALVVACVGGGSVALGEDVLLTSIQFDGLPTGVQTLDVSTGAIVDVFVPADFVKSGGLNTVDAMAAGPGRTVLFGWAGGNGEVSQYDDEGNRVGVYLGGTPNPNPVDNVRGLATSADGMILYTSDWDHDDVHRFNLGDASPAGMAGDALGTFVVGDQAAPDLGQPQAIAALANGELLVGDLRRRAIHRYDGETGDRLGTFTATGFTASFIDIDEQPNGDIVTAENGGGDRIRRFSAAGALIEEFSFRDPNGVHLLPNGQYLVSSGSSFEQGKGLFLVSASGAILSTLDDSRTYGPIELITLVEGGGGCAGDITGDGATTTSDLTVFLGAFGTVLGDPGFQPDADFNGDDAITTTDLTFLLGDFGCAS